MSYSDQTTSALVDATLSQLANADAKKRFAILQELVEYWHGPITAADSLSEAFLARFAMPNPLRRWYRWAGRRTNILSGQNFLLAPDALRRENGRLFFYHENQSVYLWATLPEGDDPPVFSREDETRPWEPENLALSEHLILACVFEAIHCHSPFCAGAAWVNRGTLDDIIEKVPAIAIPPWRCFGGTQAHARDGAFMVTNSIGPEGGGVFIGAKTPEPLGFLREYGEVQWDRATLL